MTRKRPPFAYPTLLALALALAILLPGAARAEKYALVRYFIDTPQDQQFLIEHPGLDLIAAKPGFMAEIVAKPADLELLQQSGARLEILYDDFSAFLRSRIDPAKSDNFGVYHNYNEAVAFMDSLHMLYPEVVSAKWSLGQSHEFRNLWCFRVSDNPGVDEDEPEVLFDGVHHAREPMSCEFCLMYAQYLAQNYGSDPAITYLVDNREIYFVPVVNPDGYNYNNWGDLWRKNRRNNGGGCYGVDVNRNYPVDWGGSGSSGDPCDELYRGPTAGSEPETQAMMNLINAHQFVTHNSYHTYGGLTLFPWSYTYSHTPDDATFRHIADVMTMYNGYTPGQAPEILYTVSGGMTDWAYGGQPAHAKIFSFSNEIGNDSDYFWPPESRRGPLFQENIWPATYLVRVAGVYLDAAEPVVLGGDGNGRLDPGESASLSFTLSNQAVAADAQSVTVTLSCNDPYLQLGAATRSPGTIAAQGSVNFTGDPFPVTVLPSCPVGRLVRLGLQMDCQSGTFNTTLSYLVGPPTVVFSDDFENGAGAWTRTGTWNLTTAQSHSPTHSLTDSPSGNYSNQTSTSSTLNTAYTASSLSFWHRYSIEDGWDYGYVQVSADGGPFNTVTSYTGYNTSWSQVTLPLDQYAGQSLRVRFLLETDWSVTYDGWYIDDVVLTGAASDNQPPEPPVLVSPEDGAALMGNGPTLVVQNSPDPDGSGPVTYGFRLYADALGTQLVQSVDGVAEQAGTTSWTVSPLVPETYYWRAYAADPVEFGQLGEMRSFTIQEISGIGDGTARLDLVALGPVSSGSVRLQLELPASSHVQLTVFDARGAVVRQLFAGDLGPGARVFNWDGRDGTGRAAAAGVYFARLQVGQRTLTDRVLLVR